MKVNHSQIPSHTPTVEKGGKSLPQTQTHSVAPDGLSTLKHAAGKALTVAGRSAVAAAKLAASTGTGAAGAAQLAFKAWGGTERLRETALWAGAQVGTAIVNVASAAASAASAASTAVGASQQEGVHPSPTLPQMPQQPVMPGAFTGPTQLQSPLQTPQQTGYFPGGFKFNPTPAAGGPWVGPMPEPRLPGALPQAQMPQLPQMPQMQQLPQLHTPQLPPKSNISQPQPQPQPQPQMQLLPSASLLGKTLSARPTAMPERPIAATATVTPVVPQKPSASQAQRTKVILTKHEQATDIPAGKIGDTQYAVTLHAEDIAKYKGEVRNDPARMTVQKYLEDRLKEGRAGIDHKLHMTLGNDTKEHKLHEKIQPGSDWRIWDGDDSALAKAFNRLAALSFIPGEKN